MTEQISSRAYLGTYSIPNASLYIYATIQDGKKLKLNTRHLYRWTKEGLAGGYLMGIHNHHLFITFSIYKNIDM